MNFFTPEDLLEYYYQETPPQKTAAIAHALSQNWPLQHKYDVICRAAEKLDKSIFSPSNFSINKVMEYAGRLATEQV